MSKKELVKQVIDNLIHKGMDFAELTQSKLSRVEGLEGVSRTTIKRAKKEYKVEKLAKKKDFKEQNIKRKIYKFLDRRPRTTLSELREAMPGISPAKVAEYHLFWKKKQEKVKQKEPVKKNSISPKKLKEMVFDYLDRHDYASLEDLIEQFPDAKQSSISSYVAAWKRKQRNTEKAIRGGLYEVIFRYLDSNPDAQLEDIKSAFEDVPLKSIEIYHNLWLREREENKAQSVSLNDVVQKFIEPEVNQAFSSAVKSGINQAGSPFHPRKRGRPPRLAATRTAGATQEQTARGSAARIGDGLTGIGDGFVELPENDAQLIQAMKNTIEAHNLTIFELEKEYRHLMEKQSRVIKELENMPLSQITEIRDFILTYFKGLQTP